MKRFSGKVTLVTGSSNGIGRAAAILFASEGSKVTITGRDAIALEVTKSECLSKGAKEDDILDILGDITTEEVQARLIDETVKKFGKLDILVNNHGGMPRELDEAGNLDVHAFDAAMDLNCKSILVMSLKALPHLKETKGCIVNVSSIASMMAVPSTPFYAMSKATLDHMTRLLAMRHARDGIRVNCVNPGVVKTNFMNKMGISEEVQNQMLEIFKKATIPIGRVGMPEDIAHMIAFLSDNNTAGFITGQTIAIDGGSSLFYVAGDEEKLKSMWGQLKLS